MDMTLVVAVASPHSIWMLADRRLTDTRGRVVQDDAHKIANVEMSDGKALIGYAGLGKTISEVEPSSWISNVLRGRNLPLENALGVLAAAARRELPVHLARAGTGHDIVVPALMGREARLYQIGLGRTPDEYIWTKHVRSEENHRPRAPIAVAGSGAFYLLGPRLRGGPAIRGRFRSLLHLVNACDHGRISANVVADELARLNLEVSQAVSTVGPRCIVVYRFREGGSHKGGGGQNYYTDAQKDPNSPAIPSIVQGRDMKALIDVFSTIVGPVMQKQTDSLKAERDRNGTVEGPDNERDDLMAKLNEALSQLPDRPDERLR